MIAQERLVGAHLQMDQTEDALKHGGIACFFAVRPSVNKPLVLQLIQGDYLDHRKNV